MSEEEGDIMEEAQTKDMCEDVKGLMRRLSIDAGDEAK
jgi:hypothetical protein